MTWLISLSFYPFAPFPNILSWQLLFVSGMALAQHRHALAKTAWSTNRTCISGIALLAFTFLALRHDWFGPGPEWFEPYTARTEQLGWLRLIDFFTLAALTSIILSKIPKQNSTEPIAILGRNSLQIFSYSIILSWIAKPALDYATSFYSKTTYFIFLIAITSTLTIFALALESHRSKHVILKIFPQKITLK